MKDNTNMKNIDPVSNPADVVPENQQQPANPTVEQVPQINTSAASTNNTAAQHQPAPGVSTFQFPEDRTTTAHQQATVVQPQRTAINPQVPPGNVQQNATTITPESTPAQPVNTQPTVPTPQLDTRKSFNPLSTSSSHKSITIMIVSIMTVAAALYLVVELIRGLIGTDESVGLGSSLLFGGTNWAGWLLLAIYLLQLATATYAGYKLWKGSMAALAFISGMSFLYLYAVVYSTIVSIVFILQASAEYGLGVSVGARSYIVLGLSTLYYGALVGCWTRGRKNLQ